MEVFEMQDEISSRTVDSVSDVIRAAITEHIDESAAI